MHYVLVYDVAPDYLERRGDYRDAHLARAWAAADRGELLLGGAVGDPIDGALLLFRTDSPDIPTAFAEADPYVVGGLVTKWKVMPWHTVVGEEAANPVRSLDG